MRSILLSILCIPLFASAAETPEQAVSVLWRALSNDPGAASDVATLRELFHQDAVIFGGQFKDGAPQLRRYTVETFLKPYEPAQEKGFYECEVARSIKTYDGFAVAYSVVESRTDKSATTPDFVGVNSVQLYRVGRQWKILSLYYHVGKQGLPIPLDGGRSGVCL